MSKRNSDAVIDDEISSPQGKRTKLSEETALSTTVHSLNNQLTFLPSHQKKARSHLAGPEITLTGHEAAIYSISYDPAGEHLCSASMDKQILLWEAFGENKNYNVLTGHKGAVLQVNWFTPTSILSCSADKTVAVWDAKKGARIRKFLEHTAIVNTCAAAKDNEFLVASGSDDCTAILWDPRVKISVSTVYHDYQICSVALSHDGLSLFTGGIDNIIRRFDTRMIRDDKPDLMLHGHTDTITGLSVSPDGNYLLSNAMDSNLRVWDVRPFVHSTAQNGNRCERVLYGVHHGAEKLLLRCAWSKDQEYITAGSADRIIHLWETTNYTEVCGWAGHKASINEVIIHPSEPIIASASSDRSIILGEFSPQ